MKDLMIVLEGKKVNRQIELHVSKAADVVRRIILERNMKFEGHLRRTAWKHLCHNH